MVLLLAVALPAVRATSPVSAAAAADKWERVVGDANPASWSRAQVTRVAGDGSVYLAGSFSGSFSGLTAPGVGFHYFLQKFDPGGSVKWTKVVSATALPSEPEAPVLAVDGSGIPYLRACVAGCNINVYDPATGDVVHSIPDGADNRWPMIGVAAGGILTVNVGVSSVAARRLDSGLVQLWSFDLTGALDAGAGTWLAESSNGSFWAIGKKPVSDNVMPMVHISASGGHLGTVEHTGGVPFDLAWFAVPNRSNPVAVGPQGNLWISIDQPAPGFNILIVSFSSVDGSRAGLVDTNLPHEQFATPSGYVNCTNLDLEVSFGDVATGSGQQPRFPERVSGSSLMAVMQCFPLTGGSPVSMLVVFSMASPVGGDFVREAAIPFPSTATVFDMSTNASGAVALAGVTSGPDQFLQSPVTPPGIPTAVSRAAVSHNPTGNLLERDEFAALPPVRLFDTRPTEPQGLASVLKSPIPAGGQIKVRIAGFGGVPSNGVGSVSLNVTVTNPAATGFITVHPCGDRPLASNLNYVANQTVANAVIAPVSSDGTVCFYSPVATDVLADVNGWFRDGGGFHTLTPLRIFDSRPGETDGVVHIAKQRYGGGAIVSISVGDVPGVPTDASAVSLNVTATDALGDGFVTVYPCGERPLASNLNFRLGQTVPNAVIAPLGPGSVLCFFANADTHLIADINGYFSAASSFTAVSPTRVFDTRVGESDGLVKVAKQQYGGDRVLTVRVAGVAGMPATGVGAVSLNVTATNPVASGFVTVFPCGDRPLASSVNFTTGATVANAVVTPVSASGEVCFFANVDTDLIADVNGWLPA